MIFSRNYLCVFHAKFGSAWLRHCMRGLTSKSKSLYLRHTRTHTHTHTHTRARV